MAVEADGRASRRRWRGLLGRMAVLLAVWASLVYGAGFVLREAFDGLAQVGGRGLGQWVAFPGSALGFVAVGLAFLASLGIDEARSRPD